MTVDEICDNMDAKDVRNAVYALIEKRMGDARSVDYLNIQYAQTYLGYKGLSVENAKRRIQQAMDWKAQGDLQAAQFPLASSWIKSRVRRQKPATGGNTHDHGNSSSHIPKDDTIRISTANDE